MNYYYCFIIIIIIDSTDTSLYNLQTKEKNAGRSERQG